MELRQGKVMWSAVAAILLFGILVTTFWFTMIPGRVDRVVGGMRIKSYAEQPPVQVTGDLVR